MRIDRIAITVAMSAVLAGVIPGDLTAQRRTTGSGSGGSSGGGSGSGGSSGGGERQTPSGGGERSTGGSQRGGSSGSGGSTTQRRGGSDGERETPQAGRGTREGGGNSGTASRPSTSSTRGSGNSARGSDGKIGAVRDRARAARITTSRGVRVVRGIWVSDCWSCSGYWGWNRGYWGWHYGGYWYPSYYPRYHRPTLDDDRYEAREEEEPPPAFGQTYLEHPYADDGMPGTTFVQHDVPGRSGYGTISGTWFGDRGSETQAGRFALEGGYKLFHGELSYNQYAEPALGSIDRLHTWRAAGGIQPRLGNSATLIASVGARGIVVDGGGRATGPEAGLALQMLPVRPIGINLNGRVASLSWNGQDNFSFRELNATGSVFVGRIELQGGWHYMQIDDTPAFNGPVAGLRIWF